MTSGQGISSGEGRIEAVSLEFLKGGTVEKGIFPLLGGAAVVTTLSTVICGQDGQELLIMGRSNVRVTDLVGVLLKTEVIGGLITDVLFVTVSKCVVERAADSMDSTD